MIKNVLSETGGIAMYGIASICLFFVVFVAALIFTFMKRRPYLTHMSSLPLEDESSVSASASETVIPSSHE
jgi:hypothetical protein